jgi:hypothetical protein
MIPCILIGLLVTATVIPSMVLPMAVLVGTQAFELMGMIALAGILLTVLVSGAAGCMAAVGITFWETCKMLWTWTGDLKEAWRKTKYHPAFVPNCTRVFIMVNLWATIMVLWFCVQMMWAPNISPAWYHIPFGLSVTLGTLVLSSLYALYHLGTTMKLTLLEMCKSYDRAAREIDMKLLYFFTGVRWPDEEKMKRIVPGNVGLTGETFSTASFRAQQ